MTPDALDAAARALAADLASADRWDVMGEYMRNVWRRRVALVLRSVGSEAP